RRVTRIPIPLHELPALVRAVTIANLTNAMSAHRFGRRTLKSIILLVPLAVLVGLGILMVRRYYSGAARDLAPILAAEATRALGHEVQVGKVTLRGGFAYVDDVRIAEGK